MSNSTVDLALKPYGLGGRPVTLPVDGGANIHAGTMVAQLAATAMLTPASTASSGPCIGVATHAQDNTSGADAAVRCKIATDAIYVFGNSVGDPCAESTLFGSLVYCEDDHTISKTNGGSQFAAGYFVGLEPDGNVRVFLSLRALQPADLATLATSAGAGDVGILDAGLFTAQTTVEAALQELYQQVETANASFSVPLSSFVLAAGTPLAAYSAGNTGVPGFNLVNSEAICIDWNNYPSNAGVTIWGQVAFPVDVDPAHDVIVQCLTSKTGATAGDTGKLTFAGYILSVGDVNNADTVFTADMAGMTATATAGTTAEQFYTIDAADVPVGARTLTFSLTPKTGTLETDDILLHSVRIKYTRKLQTS